MTREEAVALLERYSNYEGMGIPNLAGCKEAMKVAVDALKEAFPELAESEDERIRRWLCDYFSSIDKAWIHKDITCIDILRWLEKQKEQKQEKFPPYVTGFKGHPDPAGTSDLEEAAKEYASKTLCDPDDGPSTGLAKESFIAGAEWQKEQKPAEWSEEDEEILKLLILNIGRYMYFGGMSSERILSFLKSLRPQQRQEWSDEDEERLKAICTYLRDYSRLAKLGDKLRFNEYCDFLKSLRPQYHGDVTMTEAYKMGLEAGKASSWKPSEEQMKALNVLNCHGALSYVGQQNQLISLYNDLKKLM